MNPQTPLDPNLTPSLPLWLDLVFRNRLARGLSIPAANTMEFTFSNCLTSTACAQMHLCLDSARCSNFCCEGCASSLTISSALSSSGAHGHWRPLAHGQHFCLSQAGCTSQGYIGAGHPATPCTILLGAKIARKNTTQKTILCFILQLGFITASKHLWSMQDPIPAVSDYT